MKVNQLLLGVLLAGALGASGDTATEDERMGPHMTPAPLPLPIDGELPSFDGATTWLNSPPLTPAGLRGKVVLVQFWTYTCINWLRTVPYIRAWAEKYKDQGLVVIGVSTPEFEFEHTLDNVHRSVKKIGITWPVAVDNDYAIWRAFDNNYWPALYFVDAKGNIRHQRFGEGDYEKSERVIQKLLAEAGHAPSDNALVSVNGTGTEAPADWDSLQSPENYVGYGRTENFASPGGAAFDKPHATLSRGGWGSTSGHCPVIGRWENRPRCRTRPRGGSSTAFTPATCISSWGPWRRAPPCDFACS